MALTNEMLLQIPALEGISPEQIAAIVQASENEENSNFGAKFKKLHGDYDTIVKDVLGKDKPAKVFSTDFVKTELTALKEQADKVKDLEAINADLKKQIDAGVTDETTKAQLKKLENTLKAKEQQLTDLKTQGEKSISDWETKYNTLSEENERLKLTEEFAPAYAGRNLMPGVTDETAKQLVQLKIDTILSTTTRETIVSADGKDQIVFKDKATGQIIGDPSRNMAPANGAFILQRELSGIYDYGKNAPGGGSKPGKSKQKEVSTNIDLSGAKSKSDVHATFKKHLAAQGISSIDPTYVEKEKELLEEYADVYNELPAGYF